MINTKTVTGVVIVAILIGMLFVTIEKNFLKKPTADPGPSSVQELGQDNLPQQTPLINLPTPLPAPSAITESSDLLNEAFSLEMRDYSTYFEDLKKQINQ